MASVLEIVTETTCTWKVTNLSNCLLRASTYRCTRSSTSGAPATVRLPVAGETLIWLSGGGAIVSISCWISFQSEVLSWTVVLCSVCAAPCPPCPLSEPALRTPLTGVGPYETRISYPYRSQSDGPERCATRGRRSSRAGGLDQTATPGPRARSPRPAMPQAGHDG